MTTKSIVGILLLAFSLSPGVSAAADLGELRLSLVEGDVQIKTADTSEWAPAVINFPLKDADQIWVPEGGRTEIQSRRGSLLRLDENTAFDVLTVDDDALQFYLSQGLAYVNAKGERDTTLQVDTPRSSIRVESPAKFSAQVAEEGDTDISVYLGTISAENKKGETVVSAGKLLRLGPNSAALSQLGTIDAWERWNGDRDREMEAQVKSVDYLPEELTGYARNFDQNGEWEDFPQYGHVWRPTVQVTANWSPYRHGRWVWIGDDYVWIAHEPWGWAPYHYGRWSFIAGRGWYWVPPNRHEAYWGPGYVGWVRTPTYVSWVPLAPREVYYGHGYYGPHSVNIKKIDVDKVIVKNTYRNAHVKNSVTTVHHDTFVRGKQADYKVKENPFLKERISVGRPQISPETATKTADFRKIPKSKEPPAMAKAIKVDEVKARHRLDKKRRPALPLPEPTPAVEGQQGNRPQAVDGPSRRNGAVSPSSSQQASPPLTSGEVAPALPVAAPEPSSAAVSPPPKRRKEHNRRPDSEAADRQIISNTTEAIQQPPAPSAPEIAPPTPVAAPAPPATPVAPPPESRKGHRQGMDREVVDQQAPSKQSEAKDIQSVLPPTPAPEIAPPTPVAVPDPPTTPVAPPPEDRRKHQAKPDRNAHGQQDNSAKAEAIQQVPPPRPAPEVPPPPPVAHPEPPPEPVAPPPESRRERKPRPAREEADRQISNRPEAIQQIVPPAPEREIPPPPPPVASERLPDPVVPPPESRPEPRLRSEAPAVQAIPAMPGEKGQDKTPTRQHNRKQKDGKEGEEEEPASTDAPPPLEKTAE